MSSNTPDDETDREMIFGTPKEIQVADDFPPQDWSRVQVVSLTSATKHPKADRDSESVLISIDAEVWRQMMVHAFETTKVEVGGVLFGQVWKDQRSRQQPPQQHVWIRSLIRARHQRSTSCSLEFTHETWEAVAKERKQLDPTWTMVGWYHTHPNWGIFLSAMDLFICKSFFASPHSVALVIDPCRNQFGCFGWDRFGQEMIEIPSFGLTVESKSVDCLKEWVQASLQNPQRWVSTW